MKKNICLLLSAIVLFTCSFIPPAGKAPERQYYVISIYHATSDSQHDRISNYLQNAFLPAMHRSGIRPVGVFEELESKDSNDLKIYVLVPYRSVQQWEAVTAGLDRDPAFRQAAAGYWDTPADKPAFRRTETILLRAFPDMPVLQVPHLQNPYSKRVYELRSYESPSEQYGLNKINMFNEGGEIKIFSRLKFNTVFCAQVLAGSHMPNLMYLTTFEDMDARTAHWKAFTSDPDWKKLSGMDKYQKNVSNAVITFLRPAAYSDL